MKFDKIYTLSDIHGDWRYIRDFVLANKIKEKFKDTNNCMILLGDAGLNYFFNYRDEEAKKQLMKYPFTYFIIRGNHEERPSICAAAAPEKWHTETFWDNTVYVENDYPNIKYALDEISIYNIPYENSIKKVLVIPGAYSVDKNYRLANNWSWFENEQLSEEEWRRGFDLLEVENNFDLILSHTAPLIYEPTDLFLSIVDQSTVDKTTERNLGHIEFSINYKLWLWGHYHATRIYPKYENKQPIMLFNKEALKINKYFEDETIEFCEV